jgi:VanZ family protein
MNRPKTVNAMCVLVLSGTLVAGLTPFHRPRNAVTWLSNANGLRFGKHGIVWSSGAFQMTSSEPSCSLEIWLQPDLASASNTLLAFYKPQNPLQLSLHQYRAYLILERKTMGGDHRSQVIGIANAFSRAKPVFITISSDTQNTAIYADGSLARSFPLFRLGDACTGQLVIGTSPVENDSWRGQLKGFALYERALTAPEVHQHFETWTTQGKPEAFGHENAKAVYLFDERAGNIVHDARRGGIDLYIPARFSLLRQPFLKPFWKEFKPRADYVIDVLVNISGFVPLGFFFCAYFSSERAIRHPTLATVVLGLFVSLTIEVLQSYLPTRDSGTTDLITNTLGTFIGVRLYASKIAQALLERIL